MISTEAILYYADHPVEFVEDIIGVMPDKEQAKILNAWVTGEDREAVARLLENAASGVKP